MTKAVDDMERVIMVCSGQRGAPIYHRSPCSFFNYFAFMNTFGSGRDPGDTHAELPGVAGSSHSPVDVVPLGRAASSPAGQTDLLDYSGNCQ